MKAGKAMRVMKAAKAMKAKKATKISKVAKGKRAKASVFSGRKEKTTSGLKKTDLVKSKSGKMVAKKRYASTIGKWTAAVTKARKALGVKGFVAVKKGSALYNKAKSFYKH